MSEHELEKLLGGFAADTLTAEERKLLYTAALHDQELFNALADEQALKELLADPAVRLRLLQALTQAKTSGAGGWLSRLDWMRRPAGLAFAGGLTAAALAVVLGIKIYQDSLKQAAQSVATEDTKPETPATPAPPASQPAPSQPMESRLRAKENAEPASTPARKDVLADKMIEHERSAPSKPQELRASGAARDALKQPPEQNNTQRQADAASPAAPVPQPKQAPALSARTLFYQSFTASATEQERSQIADREETGRMAETPLQERKRAERNIGLLGKLEDRKLSAEKPLGIRYSLIMKGPGGIDLEVDPTTAVGKDDAPRLTVQTNESGYLSVLYTRLSSDTPTVLFPSSGEGHVTERKSVVIPLVGVFGETQSAEQIRLHVVFSRTARESGNVLPAEKKMRLMTEQVDPSQPDAPAEQAVYVVDPAPSASVSVEIPLSLRP